MHSLLHTWQRHVCLMGHTIQQHTSTPVWIQSTKSDKWESMHILMSFCTQFAYYPYNHGCCTKRISPIYHTCTTDKHGRWMGEVGLLHFRQCKSDPEPPFIFKGYWEAQIHQQRSYDHLVSPEQRPWGHQVQMWSRTSIYACGKFRSTDNCLFSCITLKSET